MFALTEMNDLGQVQFGNSCVVVGIRAYDNVVVVVELFLVLLRACLSAVNVNTCCKVRIRVTIKNKLTKVLRTHTRSLAGRECSFV